MKRGWLAIWLGLFLVGLLAPRPALATPSATVLITGVYYDPFVAGEASEAVQVRNVSSGPLSIANWRLSDGDGEAIFAEGATLAAGQGIWVAKAAQAFRGEFGFAPDYEYGGNSDATVPDMMGSGLSLNNTGDTVFLKDASDAVVDAMVYGAATLGDHDWMGESVQPYDFGNASKEGQILSRKRNEGDGTTIADTNTAYDWTQDPLDAFYGKKVLYPGWSLDEFFQTVKSSANATIKYCVAPDNLYECVRGELIAAMRAISMEMYALDNPNLVDAIVERLDAGVQVMILLDGAALTDPGEWACATIEAHGGECWLMASKPQANIHKRYDSEHGKWLVIDNARVLIGSENMGADAMPADKKKDGTLGTRGGYLVTDNPEIVNAAQAVMDHDFDPARYADIRRWGTNTDDFPPFGFVPNYVDGGKKYAVQFPQPLELHGTFPIELVECPDNCLRVSDALLGMVAQAGAGDGLYVEQLYEYPYWGKGTSNATGDPNLRLEAYIAAAKRGARVRILLDSYFDTFGDPRSNYAACAYVNQFSGLHDIECRLANPTGLGIHMKMVLLDKHSTGIVHLGSINGSETSNKLNRELATQVESAEALAYWKAVFDADWATTDFAPHRVFLPLLTRK